MPRKRPTLLTTILLLALVGFHCNMTRYVIRRSGPVMVRAVGVLSAYEDPDLAGKAAPGLLALVEGLLASDPENPTLLAILCQGIYEYTFGFMQLPQERVRETDPKQAERLRRGARAQYVKVYELGLRLLRTQGVRITLQKTPVAEIRKQLARLDKRAVPGLTWTALGAGSALMLGIDQPWLMQMVGKIPLLLERAAELDPGYANALPLGALGLFYGRDAMSGGSAIKSQRYFKRALAQTKRRYLLWLVLYARHWAWQFQSVEFERTGTGANAKRVGLVPKNKKKLFASLLAEVRRFRLKDAPKIRLYNSIAKRLAKRLERRLDDFLSRAPRPGPARSAPVIGQVNP